MRVSKTLVAFAALLSLPACLVVNDRHPGPGTPVAATPVGATPVGATPATPVAATPPPAALPPQPVWVDPPSPVDPPHEHVKNVALGRPTNLHAGAPEAIWIWHDGGGWHVRTTTQSQLHRFSGRVWAPKGEVGNVHATRLEFNDRFRHTGNAMTFDFQTNGGEDGFDFQIAESNCAMFYVHIDGKPRPDRVFLGAHNVNPESAVLKLCKDLIAGSSRGAKKRTEPFEVASNGS